MKSLLWALIQHDWCSYRKGKFGYRDMLRDDSIKRHREKMIIFSQGGGQLLFCGNSALLWVGWQGGKVVIWGSYGLDRADFRGNIGYVQGVSNSAFAKTLLLPEAHCANCHGFFFSVPCPRLLSWAEGRRRKLLREDWDRQLGRWLNMANMWT